MHDLGYAVDGVAFDRAQMNALGLLETGSILCGGVGSGKSRAAIGYFFARVCGGEIRMNGKGRWGGMKTPRDLYIITTARKRDSGDWEEECSNFALPNSKAGVVVDSWNNIGKYVDVAGAFFILDEQRLVGSGSWSKAFLKIASANDWILLTATPGDTWIDYCTVFVANGFYKNRTEFCREHVIYRRATKYPMIESYRGVTRLKRLREKILVDMPVRRHTVRLRHYIDVGYDSETYKDLAGRRWDPYLDEPMKDAAHAFRVLRQVTNSDPARVKAVREIFERRSRVIVFYNFDYERDILREEFSDAVCREWNGHRHEEVPSGDRWVYLVQYTAGAEAWNCTSTNTMVFYSQNYSYKITEQSEGRIDRRNTKYTELDYYYLVSRASVDIRLRRVLGEKRDFNKRDTDRWYRDLELE